MREGEVGGRRAQRWAALSWWVAAAWLFWLWAPTPPVAAPSAGTHVTTAWGAPFDARHRRMGLDSLAQCDACHAPRDTASDGQGALASSPLRIDRRDPPTPESDFERVLAGGALFTTACAGCHGSHRDGPARVATPMLDAGPATNAPIGPLSDEQVAALVAFLRCHAPALPSKPLHQRATL